MPKLFPFSANLSQLIQFRVAQTIIALANVSTGLLDPPMYCGGAGSKLLRQTFYTATSSCQRNHLFSEFRRLQIPCSRHENTLLRQVKCVHQTGGIPLDQDKVTRASLLIGLFKGLRLLFNGPLTYGWPKTANTGPGFNGRTPVQVMCDGGIPAMMKVRQHIDALRGGV